MSETVHVSVRIPRPPEEAARYEADRIADRIMERIEYGGITTKADAMEFCELLGRKDVSDGIFRWFSTKGD